MKKILTLLIIIFTNLSVSSQSNDSTKMKQVMHMKGEKMKMGMEMEVAHPFFTHMGVPEAVGVYSLRLSGLLTNTEEKKDGDFAFHFETGLSNFVGLHIRNDGVLDRQHTELMFQFAALRSKNGMSGFSPLIEFEIPTKSGGDRHINSLIGFTTALANSKFAFNQAIHFNPRVEEYEFNGSFVIKVGSRFFPIAEIFGQAIPHELPTVNLLGGLKVRLSKKLLIGVAIQGPLSQSKDFKWQLIFQPDIEWVKMK